MTRSGRALRLTNCASPPFQVLLPTSCMAKLNSSKAGSPSLTFRGAMGAFFTSGLTVGIEDDIKAGRRSDMGEVPVLRAMPLSFPVADLAFAFQKPFQAQVLGDVPQ